MPLTAFAEILDELHRMYHRREFVHPDPLQFLYDYPDVADREIVALVAGSLAYGRVGQILVSVRRVLEAMDCRPRRFVTDRSPSQMAKALAGFRHRFNTGPEVAALMAGLKKVLRRHGSLEACFMQGMRADDSTVLGGLEALAGELHQAAGGEWNHLLCDVAKGGACKRLHLMLRWLVRNDQVDPGGWNHVSPARLLVPLDVHMHRLAVAMGATARRQADRRTAIEVTRAFAAIAPDDPVRYDFCLTRLGIRTEMPAGEFLRFFRDKVLQNQIANSKHQITNKRQTAKHAKTTNEETAENESKAKVDS
jgi:uncharacterized protein (TIGR02757 family)